MNVDPGGAVAFGWERPPSDHVQFGGVQLLFCHKREAGYSKRVVYLFQVFPSSISTIPGA